MTAVQRRRALALVVLMATSAGALAAPPRAEVSRMVVAADPTVRVQADIVYASTAPGQVEPSLVKMQQTLGAKVKYLTMKKLSASTLELSATPQSLSLPNGKSAELRLVALKAGVATVAVKLPPADASYTLGQEKALYFQGGAHQGGELWLVVSQPQ